MTYSSIAPIYDTIMSHVNYGAWFGLINRVCDTWFPGTVPSILELGGGTGTLGRMLVDRGYPYLGSDFSPAMCRIARSKACGFFCADARAIPLKSAFHLVIFLYDGINYFSSLDEYKKLFSGAGECLVDNGILLFDVTTDANSRMNFIDYIDAEHFPDVSYVRHSYYETKKKIQHNDFTVFSRSRENPALFHKDHEHHTQHIFGVQEIAAAVPGSLFNIVGIWDNFSFDPYTDHSDRIHFCIQKRGRP